MKKLVFCVCTYMLMSSTVYSQINIIQKTNAGITISPNGIRGSLPLSTAEDTTNISIGENALKSNINSKRNIAIGKDALMTYSKAFISSDLLNASQLAIGFEALRNYTTTSAALNIAIGTRAMGGITQDGGSVAIGHFSMENNRGGGTVAIGHRTLSAGSTDTDQGVFIGNGAGSFAPSGTGTVAVGHSAMNFGGGGNNTVIGSGAGGGTGTSSKIGSGNIMIGSNAGKLETGDDKLYIENTSGGNPLIGGNFSTDRVGINRQISDIDATPFTLQVGGNALVTNGIKLTNIGEAEGRFLRTDAAGNASWAPVSSLWQVAGTAGNEIQNTNVGGFWSNNPATVAWLATDITNPPTAPVLGGGTRMMWIPSRSAFRCGSVDNTNWDPAFIGLHSFASGYNSMATGRGNIAMGFNAISDGTSNTIAFGENTRASGTNACAIGNGVNANSFYSTVVGSFNLLPFAEASTWVGTDPLFTIGSGQNELNRRNGLLMLKNGKTAIGNITPESFLHVFESESSAAPSPNTIATFEKNGNGYISLLTPEASENGITFGLPSSGVSGGIIYNPAGTKSMQFRTAGNTTRMAILANGNVGINTTSATAKLDVSGTVKIGTNGSALDEIIKISEAADLPSIPANGSFSQTFTVTNAQTSSTVYISPDTDLTNGIIIAYARVSASNTVLVKFNNVSAAPIDLASTKFHITVIR
ncbi:hypothetical protein [Runella salmonicolor]|uniref:Head domain of trimeric autotransporter adhesin n=1 Tax=Runella salmonicolor TaxID=2950278 RepID=A0ABT1FM54_9BACT|nr:hypothetical protein [Runella salmonicolor]MCP1382853.1 hypothetical protein [Runella salmonicolor]